MKQNIFPVRIVEYENIDNVKSLLKRKTLQISIEDTDYALAKSGGCVILDFGKENHGGARILIGGIFGCEYFQFRVRFGESLTECSSEIQEKNSTNDHSTRDFIHTCSPWSDHTLGQTGYRFVRIDFLGPYDVQVKSIIGTNQIYSRKAKYIYAGEDIEIRKIFDVAKRTIDLCASSTFVWDGIKRDRLVWIGDMHPEMLALSALYGRTRVLENSLDYMRKHTPLPKFMNNFPTYSMWWVIILCDYFFETKAYDFTKRQLKYLQALIALFDHYVNDNGEMLYPSYFVDWPTKDTEDELTGSRFIHIIAVDKAKKLLENFGLDIELCEKLKTKLLKGNLFVKKMKQVIALKYLALGEIDDREYVALIKDRAQGMSTFMSYYILSAVASRNKTIAIDMLKEYYGAMIEKGATTFWEDFDMTWVDNSCSIDAWPLKNQKDIHGDFGAYCYKGFRHSLCHGWSSGIIKFIYEYCE